MHSGARSMLLTTSDALMRTGSPRSMVGRGEKFFRHSSCWAARMRSRAPSKSRLRATLRSEPRDRRRSSGALGCERDARPSCNDLPEQPTTGSIEGTSNGRLPPDEAAVSLPWPLTGCDPRPGRGAQVKSGASAQRLQGHVRVPPRRGNSPRSVLPGFRWTIGERQSISTSSDSSSRPAVCYPAPQDFPLGLRPNATTFDFNPQTIQGAPRRRFRLERSALCAALPSAPACRSRAGPLWQQLARLVRQLRGGYGRRGRQHDGVRRRQRWRAAAVQQRDGLRHRVRRHAKQRLALRRLRDQVSARCSLRRRRLHVPDWAASLRHGLCRFGY